MMVGILTPAEVGMAPQALRRAVDLGLQEALLELARWHCQPLVGDPDYSAAEDVLREALEKEVEGAAIELVKVRWFFRREEASEAEQVEALKICRGSESPEALCFQGLLTCAGFGCAPDPSGASALQLRAADAGSVDALFELYVHYAQGLGVEANAQRAFEFVLQAAERGHPRALYNVGASYATGRDVEKDMAKAAAYYEQAVEAGNGRAALTLGVMYATGEGVETDLEYAEELLYLAESHGYDTLGIREELGLA